MSSTIDDDFFNETDIPADDSFLNEIMNSDASDDSDIKEKSQVDVDFLKPQEPLSENIKEDSSDDFFVDENSKSEEKNNFFTDESSKDEGIDDFFGSIDEDGFDRKKVEKSTEGIAGLDENPFGDSLFKASADSFGSAGIDENPFDGSLFGNTATNDKEKNDGNPFADFDKSPSSKKESFDEGNPFADLDNSNPFSNANDNDNPFADLNDTDNKEQKKSPLEGKISSDENPFW